MFLEDYLGNLHNVRYIESIKRIPKRNKDVPGGKFFNIYICMNSGKDYLLEENVSEEDIDNRIDSIRVIIQEGITD